MYFQSFPKIALVTSIQFMWNVFLNSLDPKSDQHLISPYSNTAKSFIKIMRIKEMITNTRSFDLQINSPCQYQKKYIEKSMENVDTDVWV